MWFQEDGATCLTVQETIKLLHTKFASRAAVSRVYHQHRPPRPHTSQCSPCYPQTSTATVSNYIANIIKRWNVCRPYFRRSSLIHIIMDDVKYKHKFYDSYNTYHVYKTPMCAILQYNCYLLLISFLSLQDLLT